jgi:pSer/pThr/pTyr-binding forkhead associated (FHA) protein
MAEMILELFRRACGSSAPFTLVCEAPSDVSIPPRRIEGTCPFLLIGRDSAMDLSLSDRQVSRRHAYLQVVAGGVFCIDLNSRSKVFFEGHEDAQSQGWLQPGRFIQIGPYQVQRTDDNPGLPPGHEKLDPFAPLEEGRFEPNLPAAALELPVRAGAGSGTWAIDGMLALVGRSDRCQLVLSDDSISRFHASLVRTPQGMWVIDLVAREGVYVNGVRVRWAWLEDGDAIRIGRFTFVLRYETPPAEIRRSDVPLESGAGLVASVFKDTSLLSNPSDGGRNSLALRAVRRARDVIKAEPYRPGSAPAAQIGSSQPEWSGSLSGGMSPLAMWQQQMQLMEAFHNDMIMMVQMFMVMHREQLASVREEFERVQQLTRELSVLQSRLGTASGDAGLPLTSDTAGPGQQQPALKAREQRKGRGGVRALDSDHSGHKAEPAPRARTPGTGSTSRPPPQSGESAQPEPVLPRTGAGAAAPMPSNNVQMHAHLSKRIAELQKERQGYWQKILNTINK